MKLYTVSVLVKKSGEPDKTISPFVGAADMDDAIPLAVAYAILVTPPPIISAEAVSAKLQGELVLAP